jgi:type I restriction enzyme, S subunit
MDAKQFLTEFRHIVSAPRDIQLLRELILQLAIQGDLVANSNSAKSASELIAEIAEIIEMRIRRNEIRRQTPLLPVSEADQNFRIPNNWAFARLGSICEIARGITFPASQKRSVVRDDLVTCLRTTNIQREIDWSDLIYVDTQFVRHEDQWLRSGDIIISMANSYTLVGKVALVREVKKKATFGGFLAAIRPYLVAPGYLYLVMCSPYMQTRMRDTASQTTNIANISLRGISPISIPIPPLEEQKRIVAKVDKLMALCDKLEAQHKERDALCAITRTCILNGFSDVKSISDLRISWDRLKSNLSILIYESEHVDQLKIAILELAVSGKLNARELRVPDEILERMQIRKRDLANKKLIKRERPVVDFLGVDELRVNIPETWIWCRLNDIASIVRGGSLVVQKSPERVSGWGLW